MINSKASTEMQNQNISNVYTVKTAAKFVVAAAAEVYSLDVITTWS